MVLIADAQKPPKNAHAEVSSSVRGLIVGLAGFAQA